MLPCHAMKRALERCPSVCPGVLIRRIKHGVLSGDDRVVQYVARIRKEDFKDLYYLRLPNGFPRYTLVITPTGFVVTFLLPGSPIWTTRGQFLLGENGLEEINGQELSCDV